MYPDLGIALIEREELKPFRLTVLNDLTLAEDRVLGWMIIGLTQQFFTSAVDSNRAPIIQEPMMRSGEAWRCAIASIWAVAQNPEPLQS